MAMIVTTDGQMIEHHPASAVYELEELQGIVGIPIEMHRAPEDLWPEGLQIVMHEEGRLIGLEPNPTASALVGFDVVGDVILVPNNELDIK